MATNLRSLPIGTILSDYRIERVLGQGGFGITYQATDLNLERQVAIKEYYPRDWAERDRKHFIRAIDDEDARKTFVWGKLAFEKEAQLLASFQHPNIIAVRRLFKANGTAYFVMDYSDGRPLDKIISSGKPITERQLEKIWNLLLDGLQEVHDRGFLHRDIKPANIYIREDGSPVLLDFGSARRSDLEHNHGVTVLVADGYSPIEQYDAKSKQGAYTDIYGLAATLYRVVTGSAPPSAPIRAFKETLQPAAEKAKGKYAADLLAAIDAGLAVGPKSRPQDIAEWRAMMNRRPTPKPSRPNKPQIEYPWRKEPTFEPPPGPPPIPVKPADGVDEVPGSPTPQPLPPVKPEPAKKSAQTRVHWGSPIFIGSFVVLFIALIVFLDRNSQPPADTAALPTVVGKPDPSDIQPSVEIQGCVECPTMRLVPAGTFTMGSPNGEAGRAQNEGPQRTVSVAAFYVSKFEITAKQWRACVSVNKCVIPKGYAKTSDDMPMTHVTWDQAQAYVQWLSTKGTQCQLPTEAQWEYAARAGSESEYFFGTDKLNLGIYAWHLGNSNKEVHAVGLKKPNNFGLFDMYGNVGEWTKDSWKPTFQDASKNAEESIIGNKEEQQLRVIRGGDWTSKAEELRSAARYFGKVLEGEDRTGFRVVCKPS